MKFASVQTLEKIPRGIELIARGVAGHGSVPLRTNPIAHLAAAVARVAAWKPPIRLNDTTRAYFKRLAAISTPADAKRYLDVIGADPEARRRRRRVLPRARAAARLDDPDLDLAEHHPGRLPHQRDPVGGPGDARRAHASGRQPRALLDEVRKVVNDPAIEVAWGSATSGRQRAARELDSEAFKAIEAAITKHYSTVTLPTMSTGRDRHGVPAREGHPVLRHRSGDRHRGRPEGLRRAQRSGADPRKRAAPVRGLLPQHWPPRATEGGGGGRGAGAVAKGRGGRRSARVGGVVGWG